MTTAPSLSQLGDPGQTDILHAALATEAMSRRLAPFLGGDTAVRVVHAQLVAHLPSKRAVITYVTAGPQGDGPSLVAKIYTDTQRAERVHAILEQLYALSADGHACGVPRPVAHLPELGMSVYEAARGRTLDCLTDVDRREAMSAAGRWLAALHHSGIRVARCFDMARERRKLAMWADLVARDHPPAAAMTARLLELVDSLAGRVQLSTSTPIHKDFHYQHVLVDCGRVSVIDLDEVRKGDPAFDIAHFRVNLRLLALREEMADDELAALDRAFITGYGTRSEPDACDPLFRAYTCLKIAWQLVLGKGPTPVPVGADLSRQLELVLADGLR